MRPFLFGDFFAGIGGFHQALRSLKGRCVAMCEKDAFARLTYRANHPGEYEIHTDITALDFSLLPYMDILCAGFPCQPFSVAGFQHGFRDRIRGTLFFSLMQVVEAKKPPILFLENVRHLIRHDNGRTLETIREAIVQAGYTFQYAVVKASDFNLPQHRPRVFIVCFRRDLIRAGAPAFEFPKPVRLRKTMTDVFGAPCDRRIGCTLRVGGRGSPHGDRRNWDSYMVDGKVTIVTPLEGRRLMGFPESFEFPKGVSATQAMKQLGNSVAVPAVRATAEAALNYLEENFVTNPPVLRPTALHKVGPVQTELPMLMAA